MINQWHRWFFFKIGFPVIIIWGWLFRIKSSRLQSILVNINNSLVYKSWSGSVKTLLLLLPHCIQNSECKIRITFDVNNCEKCGKCPICEFIKVAEKHNLKLSVATGGGIARRTVDNTRPDAVVAVACERDLIGGIRDIYPVPTLGIVNERPFGPCFNTVVDIDLVKNAITFFGG
jgi:hypothetical protein